MEAEHSGRFLSAIQGSLIGGAVGDALGYSVEFQSWRDIQKEFGPAGIQRYQLDTEEGAAIVSDDTQMTLFTANGLLRGDACNLLKGVRYSPVSYIFDAYRDWYFCQRSPQTPVRNHSWLSALPEMHKRRAPGSTCMSALGAGRPGDMEEPINFSKGCGGVMRVAPVALWDRGRRPIEEIDLLGAGAAALTHGHPLGYMSAAALVHIVSQAAFGPHNQPGGLYAIVADCREAMGRLFANSGFLGDLLRILDQAVEFSRSGKDDPDNIHLIGGGWTGEEALGIALYCSLKYQEDFSRGVIAAVNHSGDSDSTGAIAGNILGAWLGMEAIEEKWLDQLELKGVLLETARDLFAGCPQDKAALLADENWQRKYGAFCR